MQDFDTLKQISRASNLSGVDPHPNTDLNAFREYPKGTDPVYLNRLSHLMSTVTFRQYTYIYSLMI